MRVHYLLILSAAMVCAGPLEDTLATGRKALGNDGVATAWKLAQRALADRPESAAVHEFAGEVLFRRGQFAQSDAEFKNAIELDPKLAAAWWGLARVAECAAMNRTAVEDYKRAYELDPKDPRIAAAWAPRLAGARTTESGKPMALASSYHAMEIPLLGFVNDATHVRSYGVEVMVNGNPVKLVLDTGAAGVVMTRVAAERVGLRRLSDTRIGGVGDNDKATSGYRALAEQFRIGDIDHRNALISVTEQNQQGIEDGLIGSSVFSQYLITLDFAGGKLRLDPLPGYRAGELQDRQEIPEMPDASRVFRFGHILLVPVRVNSHEGLFALDTGAAGSMMSYDLAAEASKLGHDDRTAVRGLSGKVADVYQTGAVTLEFAGFTQKNLAMTAIDTWQLSHRLGTEISGFLGLPVLELFKLTIDYRDGLVKFERSR